MEQVTSASPSRHVSSEEAELHEFMEQFAGAISKGNLDDIMSYYSEDVVAYDMPPPLEYSGKAKFRSSWKDCFTTYFKFPVEYDYEQQKVHVSGDLALVHGLVHMVGEPKDGGAKMESWLRNTIGLRKVDDKWEIIHDHSSVPIGFDGQPKMNLNPNGQH